MAIPVFLQQISLGGSGTIITINGVDYDLLAGDAVFTTPGRYTLEIPNKVAPNLSVVMWAGGGGGSYQYGYGGHAGAARGIGMVGGDYRMVIAGGGRNGNPPGGAGGTGGYGGGGGGGGVAGTQKGAAGSVYGNGGAGGYNSSGNGYGAAGGGGGATAILSGTSYTTVSNTVLAAGGGSGGIWPWELGHASGGGGTNGFIKYANSFSGRGGTQSAGGAAGIGFYVSGIAGGAGYGGGGGNAQGYGAGGGAGGGYYGGGGGGHAWNNATLTIDGETLSFNPAYGGGGSGRAVSSYFTTSATMYNSGGNSGPGLASDTRKPSFNTGRGGRPPSRYYPYLSTSATTNNGGDGAIVFYLA